jgi:hypothetical protein
MATDAWLTRRAEVVAEGNELLDHAEDIEMAGDLDPFYCSVRKLPEREAERLSVLQRE